MSLIKFPTQIKPSRVTIQLQRVDETFASPLTNIQQVVSRGNPAWKWTYEFTNLSESEREIVQAFLINCRGSLNTFKVRDPSQYSLRGNGLGSRHTPERSLCRSRTRELGGDQAGVCRTGRTYSADTAALSTPRSNPTFQ